jgi:hypothetical protein
MKIITYRILLLITFFLLSSCRTPNANLTIVSATPYGSSVEKVCGAKNINYREKREFPSGGYGPEIELCTRDSYIEYNEKNKTMIVVGKNAKGQNAGGYFVFENVSKPLNCNLLFCIYGDGKFKHVATFLEEARRYADPELLAEYEKEEEKKRIEEERLAKIRAKEEERLAKIRAKEEEARLIKEKENCSANINLDTSWKYTGYFKESMTYDFKSKTDKPIIITRIGLRTSNKQTVFEKLVNIYIGPYSTAYATANIGNINKDVVEYGFYRCEWATSANSQTKPPSNTYIPPNNTNSGVKDTLKKIIGK